MLDAPGGFFESLEKWAHAATGVEPRCWRGEEGFSAEYLAAQREYAQECAE